MYIMLGIRGDGNQPLRKMERRLRVTVSECCELRSSFEEEPDTKTFGEEGSDKFKKLKSDD
jgi:hypothetical protein